MLPNEKKWNKEKIESLFSPDVANNILDVPLFDTDKLVWNDNIHGQYSVKSGYNMLFDDIGRGVNPTSQVQWNNIWKIKAPPKAKHLLWRICRGCIPTRTRLQTRCVPCPLICPICEHIDEDNWHAFFNCHDSIHARQSAGLDHLVAARVQHISNAAELIFSTCSEEDCDIAGQFAMLLWTLWKNRNEKVWNNVKEAGRSLGFKAVHAWNEWISVQQHHSFSAQQQQHVTNWQKPPMNWYKCNVDAGFYKASRRTTVGWCVRDHLGGFVKAGTLWKEGQFSIVEGESYALLEPMKAMEQQGITKVIFETC
jgi:hypothetical protein